MGPLLGQTAPGRSGFRVNDARICVLGGHCSGQGRSCGVMRPPGLRRRRALLRIRSQEGGQEHQQPTVAVPRNVFNVPKEKAGLQGFLSDIPRGISFLGALCSLGLAAVAGYSIGGKAPADARTVSRAIGTAVGVGTAAFAVLKMEESRQDGAAVDLHNSLVAKDDPGTLTRSEVEEIEEKYGVKMPEKLATELKLIYDQYLSSMVPSGTELVGNEAEKVASFKDALGISDEDAAAVHMDVGRRLARLSVESENKLAEMEARKTFQKWIYISYRVFGERKSAFLLPLQRVFGLTQSQIMVARRDNAKNIFRSKIDEMGGRLQADRKFLEPLRVFQREIMLKDDVAGEVVRDAARLRVESSLDTALKNVRERTRKKDYSLALKEIQGVLEFNREMEALGAESDEALPPGLGKVTIHGGVFEENVNTGDQRDLFRIFLEERLALDGQITVNLEKDLEDLSVVLALGPKEADSIREEVASKLYRKLLKDEVTSGRLDSAESKATVLQKLCDRVRFKPELAALMHKNIYKQKVDSILAEEKKISDERDEELGRLRKLMCIPERDVEEVMLECVGGLLKVAIDDALSAGLENFGEHDRKNVKRAIEELRTGEKMAMSVLTTSARQAFMKYVSQSRLRPNKLEAAKELKKMVLFSNIVVAPLIQDIKGDDEAQKAAAQAEFEEILAEAKQKAAEEEVAEKASGSEDPDAPTTAEAEAEAEAYDGIEIVDQGNDAPGESSSGNESEDMPSSLKKSTQGAESFKAEDGSGTSKETSQKQITLGDDLDVRDRVDMYRNYLIYCMSGDVMQMPMGGTVVLERDASEFGRLSQLGDVLGLTPMDVMKVHTDMAEDAYRNQVKAILADGMITKEKTEALSEVREKLGLNKEQGDKIVRGVQNEALAQSMQSAKAMGELDLQKVLDMKESGVEIESFTSPEFRKSLFQKEATKVMSDGKGDFDREYLMEQLPNDLIVDKDQALKIVKEAALSKSKFLTVQAMSDLRMKKLDNAVEDVNNLLVCTQIIGAEGTNGATKWDRREEILDLFSVYYWKVQDEEKVSNVQSLFGVSDSEAAALKKTVDSGGLKWADEAQKEDEIFF